MPPSYSHGEEFYKYFKRACYISMAVESYKIIISIITYHKNDDNIYQQCILYYACVYPASLTSLENLLSRTVK